MSTNLSALPYLPNGPTVYILRGVSGSGKSSVMRNIIQNLSLPSSSVHIPTGGNAFPTMDAVLTVCSADNYFISPSDGVYRMDLTKLKDAHAWCEGQFALALETGVPLIIVDNTNTAVWNYSKYEEMLLAYNFEIEAGLHPFPRSLSIGNSSNGNASASSSSSSASTVASSSSSTTTTVPLPSSSSSLSTTGSSTVATQPPRKDYELKIIEIDCPDAATLYLFNSRQVHGVPWETSIRQWTMFENDPRSLKISPYLDPVKDIPFIDKARTLPIVQAAQDAKNNPSAHPPLHPNRNNNNRNNNNRNYGNHSNGNRSRTNSTHSNDSTDRNNHHYHQQQQSYGQKQYNNSNNRTGYRNPSPAPMVDADGWETVGTGNNNNRRGNNNNHNNNKHLFFNDNGTATSTTTTASERASLSSSSGIVSSSVTNLGIQSIVELAPKVIHRINYLGFFLKQESTDVLLKTFPIPDHFTARYCHHITIAFSPTIDECTPSLMECMGCDVQLQVYAYAMNKEIMACAVRWPRKTVPLRSLNSSSSDNSTRDTTDSDNDGEDVMDTDGDIPGDDDENESDNDDNEENNDQGTIEADTDKPLTVRDDTNEGNSIDIVNSSIGTPDKNGFYNGILENRLSHIGPNGMVRCTIPHVSIASLPRVPPQNSNEMLEKKQYRLKKIKPFPIIARFGAKVSVSGGYQIITNPHTWKQWYTDKYSELYK